MIHHVGQVVKGVIELLDGGLIAITKARHVGRDHVVVHGEFRNEVAIHMRRGGKAVQKNDGRLRRRSRFPVKDVEAVNPLGLIAHPVVSLLVSLGKAVAVKAVIIRTPIPIPKTHLSVDFIDFLLLLRVV